MAWGATFDVSDTSTDFYDQAMQKLVAEVTHGIPEGCIVHIMSPHGRRLPRHRGLGVRGALATVPQRHSDPTAAAAGG